MSLKIHVVNFGQSSGGLTTVGYTLLNPDGTTKQARSTSGVVEYGTSTGVYGAMIDYNQFDVLVVLWDTGGATPRYAIEENRTSLAAIQDETDHIRMIWNSIKNRKSKEVKDYTQTLTDIEDSVKSCKKAIEAIDIPEINFPSVPSIADIKKAIPNPLTLKEIKEALTITVKPADVHIPEVKIPPPIDYRIDMQTVKTAMIELLDFLRPLARPMLVLHAPDESISKITKALNEIKDTIPSDQSAEIKGSIQSAHDSIKGSIIGVDKSFGPVVEKLKALEAQLQKMGDSNAKQSILNTVHTLTEELASRERQKSEKERTGNLKKVWGV